MTKDELIERYRDINVDYDWWDCTYEDFVERLAEAGIAVTRRDICFSGFWSQGDGAQFSLAGHSLLELVEGAQKWMVATWPDYEGKGEDGKDAGGPIIAALHDYCEALLAAQEVYLLDGEARGIMSSTSLSVSTHNSHFYCHSGGMTAELAFDISNYPDDDSIGVKLKGLFQSSMRALADALYKALESEYDYQTADEQVWDMIVANGLDEELTQDEEDEEPCNG